MLKEVTGISVLYCWGDQSKAPQERVRTGKSYKKKKYKVRLFYSLRMSIRVDGLSQIWET